MGGREYFEMRLDPLASYLQLYKAMGLLHLFLQFLQDRGENETAHKYRLCILLLVTAIF